MKKTSLLAAALLVSWGGFASAAVINLTSVTNAWGPTTGGVNVAENVSFGRFDADPADGFNQVRWGIPFPGSPTNGRSGLGFRGNAPQVDVGTDVFFKLGDLRHYNWTIGRNQAASNSVLSLGVSITIDGNAAPGNPYNLQTSIAVDETPNSGTCPYPSDTPCSDKITFNQVGTSDTFTIGGIEYEFKIVGFGPTAQNLQNEFISQESQNSTVPLWAVITATTPNPTPEPAPIGLMALGLMGMSWVVRRVNRKA